VIATPSVSVVVPVHNRFGEIRNLLDSLKNQSYDDFEVVIVDDGSSPAVAEMVQTNALPFEVRVVRLDTCGGVGRARNVGVTNAKGLLIVFVDSDSIVQASDWLRRHIAAHEGDLCVVHGRVIGIHTTYAGYSDGYSNWFTSCGTRRRVLTNRHVPANNTSVPRHVFEIVGLFDEGLTVLEDLDWAFRCLRHGVTLVYDPDVPIGHVDRSTFGALWRHYRLFGRVSLTVRSQNPGSPRGWMFPWGPITAWLYLLPLSGLMTVYVTAQWLSRELRVLWYVPGIFLANLAYCWGIIESLHAPAATPDDSRP
jgi:GT2 family glycosyltransferase